MFEYPVSDALKDLLDRKGMRVAKAATGALRRNEKAGVSRDGDSPQVPATGVWEVNGGEGTRLVWVNPTDMRQSAQRSTKRAPWLMLVNGK